MQTKLSKSFLNKYNRTVIIVLEDNEEVTELNGFKWMTIGQVKYFATHSKSLFPVAAFFK